MAKVDSTASLLQMVLRLRDRCLEQERVIQRRCDLTASEYACMRCQPRDGSISCGELAQALGLSPSRSTRVVDGLVARGLLQREVSLHDRRVNLVRPTAKGRRVKAQIDALLSECEAALSTHLSRAEVDSAALGLATVLRAMEKIA